MSLSKHYFEIPNEVIELIFGFAHHESYFNILVSCKGFNNLCKVNNDVRYYHLLKKQPKIINRFLNVETEELSIVLVKYYYENLKYIKNKNKKVILEAVRNNGFALQFASESLKNDKDVVLEAVKNKGRALKYASESLKEDKEIVLEAVKNTGFALNHSSKSLKKDKDAVLEAVKNDGYALEFASKPLKNDKEVVLEAVKNDGFALQYASKPLKNNKEVVLEAVRNIVFALEYASESLKNDKEIVLLAVKINLTCVIGIKIPLDNDIIAYLSEKLSDKHYIKKVSYDEYYENYHLIKCQNYLEQYSTVPITLKEFIDSL